MRHLTVLRVTLVAVALLAWTPSAFASIDQTINDYFAPVAKVFSDVVFFSVDVGGASLKLIVLWLVIGAVFFTVFLRFINLRGFVHAIRIVAGKEDPPGQQPGEISHFQALTTAVSGTIGVGNIAHVAVAVSIGGPGAAFWMIVAGFLGMASKFTECTLGVKYRQKNADGSVSGGPMFYLDRGLAERGWPRLGKFLAHYYALCIVVGCLGIGCMFQANQAFVQFVTATGGQDTSIASGNGWLFGLVLAVLVAVVILGGIRSIAKVTSKLVPFMAVLYILTALIVIGWNYERVPAALVSIVTTAFSPEGIEGGIIAVLILGFRRAAFSNEAGIGSSAVAHAAVKTDVPVTQGFVAMLEPFLDTIVVCTITALVITVAYPDPTALGGGEMGGVEMTSAAFAAVLPWFPYVLSFIIMMFAYSTMISWSYYGVEGSIYLFGAKPWVKNGFNLMFCLFVVLGCTTQLAAILDFSDAMIFAMALGNIAGLYLLAPVVKKELDQYWASRAQRNS